MGLELLENACVLYLKQESEFIFSAGAKSQSLEVMGEKVKGQQFFMCKANPHQ